VLRNVHGRLIMSSSSAASPALRLFVWPPLRGIDKTAKKRSVQEEWTLGEMAIPTGTTFNQIAFHKYLTRGREAPKKHVGTSSKDGDGILLAAISVTHCTLIMSRTATNSLRVSPNLLTRETLRCARTPFFGRNGALTMPSWTVMHPSTNISKRIMLPSR